MANLNNYKGALLGLAVGDALGATTENMRTQDIKAKYGVLKDIIGGGWLGLDAGQVTDDTDMTIAVANGIIQFEKDDMFSLSTRIGNEFIKWRDSNPVDIGNITRLSMSYYDKLKDWRKASKKAHEYMNKQSAGNGSLMRCLPVALVYGSSFMEVVTEMQSAMTHFDPRASEACILYNRIARRIISGQELRESIREEIHNTHYQSVAYRDPVNRPSGFVVDTFEWVLRVLLTTDSYEEVVVALTNEGSDSDTTSAIAGGLAGLYYGLDAIPERLSSKIIRRNEILDIAEKLYNLSGE